MSLSYKHKIGGWQAANGREILALDRFDKSDGTEINLKSFCMEASKT
jgi:hypothetical protein